MEQNGGTGFCPRCGALMRDGVCQSCEYVMGIDVVTKPEKRKNKGLIIGLVIGGVFLVIVLLVAVLIMGYFILNLANVNSFSGEDNDYLYDYNYDYNYGYNYGYNEDEEDDIDTSIYDSVKGVSEDDNRNFGDIWDDVKKENERIDLDGDGEGDLEFELGEEGLNADYYPFITDYIRYDLDYSVTFGTYVSDDGRVECNYPQLSGAVPDINYINNFFYSFMKETEKIAKEYNCNAKSDAYVTYMDEDIISVVFIELYTFSDETSYESIYCHSYNIDNGTRIYFELMDDSDEFLNELEERCLVESTSDAPYLFENYSKDEIRNNILKDDFGLVAFYTPLGMEIGLNYDGYWCCSTFKDYEKYIIEIVSEAEEAEF